MFSLFFGLGMLVNLIIHFFTIICYNCCCNKCKTLNINSRQKLFENTDWTHIYNNPDLIEYSLQESRGLVDEIDVSIATIRDRALSVMNYLFLTLGGLFYIFFDKLDKLQTLEVANIILIIAGYITCEILYLAYNFIVPNKNETYAKYSSPINHLPYKDNKQNIKEVKIEQILSMQACIEANTNFMKKQRKKLFYILLNITVAITITIIYFCLFTKLFGS